MGADINVGPHFISMSTIYQEFKFAEDDTLQERMEKLYLGIISTGEDLYCKGAAVAELNKQLNDCDRKVADMRRELDALKEKLAKRSQAS